MRARKTPTRLRTICRRALAYVLEPMQQVSRTLQSHHTYDWRVRCRLLHALCLLHVPGFCPFHYIASHCF